MPTGLYGKIIKALLIAVPIFILGYLLYAHGKDTGETKVNLEWKKEKEATNQRIQDLMVDIGVREQKHRNEATRIAEELENSNAKFQADIADMRADYDKRLRESNARADIYQRLSKAGPAQQERLAGYATRLDGSLAEGRSVVKELRATIEQRDRELRLLGAQIIAYRTLMGGNDEPAGSR